ncbi:carbohydrate kinase family protein [Pleomorphomonas koreensis]|uniref:carbohydrate kinase family protein n=1 Tax=Pleomorphomonas koreensis TaxID=257440 RepID=UPI000417B62C|nr:carbohydrate kinase [Pleomorphomonas koreensis]
MDLLAIGEMVIDFLPGPEPGSYLRNAGGAPANVAIAATRSGLTAAFLGKLGNDDFGRFLVATLEENGVEVVLTELTDEAVTTMTFVTLGEDGERSFTFVRKPGADMLLAPADIRTEVIAAATIVHIGSCSLSRSPSAEATLEGLRLARNAGKLVSFDVNYRAPLWQRESDAVDRIAEALPFVDLLKVSEEEVHLVGGPAGFTDCIAAHGIAVAVETLGARGARCHFAGQTVDVPAPPAVAVDATGAGDAFWGAFLAHLVKAGVRNVGDIGLDALAAAARYGAAAGSLCVRRKGAIAALPTRTEILDLLNKEAVR